MGGKGESGLNRKRGGVYAGLDAGMRGVGSINRGSQNNQPSI